MGALTWELNLGGAELSSWQAARHEARAYTADIGRFEEGVRLQVHQAHSGLTLALEQQRTAALALEAGRENLRILEERFAQGVAGTLDVLDARTALRELETRELVARHQALGAARTLTLVSGGSLDPDNKKENRDDPHCPSTTAGHPALLRRTALAAPGSPAGKPADTVRQRPRAELPSRGQPGDAWTAPGCPA
jgi:outer membrane protein TolC